MMLKQLVLLLSGIALMLVTPAAGQTLPSVGLGEPAEVQAGPDIPLLALTITAPQFVTLLADGVDDAATPVLVLSTAAGRDLISAYDSPVSDRYAGHDSVIENFYLLPGSYTLRVENLYDTQRAAVSVEPGDPGPWGAGVTETFSGTLVSRGRFRQTLTFEPDEIVTISVLALSDTLDAYLELRDARGVPVAIRHERDSLMGDRVLNDPDPQLKYFHIPAGGLYDLEIYGTNDTDAGDFQVYLTRYGRLVPAASTAQEVFTGNVVVNGRQSFTLVAERGEVVTITVRALTEQLDPFLTMLNPQGVIVAVNDDHGFYEAPLQWGDARLANFLIPESGKYTLEITSAGGSGPIEMTVERIGTFALPGE